MRIGPGGGGSSSSLSVVECHRAASILGAAISSRGSAAITAAELGPRSRRQRDAQRSEVAADRLELAHERLRVASSRRCALDAARGSARASRARRRAPALRLEDARAYSRASTRSRAPRITGATCGGHADARRELLVGHRARSPRSRAAGSAAGRSARRASAGRAPRGSAAPPRRGCRRRAATRRSRRGRASRASFRRRRGSGRGGRTRAARAERLEEPAVQRLVRAMVVAADDVRDAEVDVVDDASRAGRSPCRPRGGA